MSKRFERLFFLSSIVALIIGIYLLYLVSHTKSLSIDKFVSDVLFFSNSSVIHFFQYFTQLGSKIGIGIVALIAILWLWLKHKDYNGMATVALAVGIGNELNKLIKDWIARPRPKLEHLDKVSSYSFPSGHAMVGIILYMLIAYFLVKYIPSRTGKRIALIVCIAIILLLGISRIVLHVHFATDILAGYAFGFIWAFLWILIYEKSKAWTGKNK